jgi:hypothetical protein
MSSALRRLIAGGCTVVLLIVGVQLLGITAASAHANIVSGSPTCVAQTGKYAVTWTITNDWKDDAETASVNSYTPGAATLSSNSVHINKASASSHSATITESNIPGNATSASLSVQGLWDDKYTQADSGKVTLGGTCQPAHTPTAPSWHNGKCDSNFQQVSPTVTIPSDAGVAYKLDGTGKSSGTYPVSGGQHTIDATSSTLTLNSPTSWTFTLTSAPGNCNTTTKPVAPTVEQSKCNNNHQPTNPTLTLPSTLGITYSVDKAGPYQAGDTVTVTATASDGYEFDNLHNAWTFVSSKKETLTITFDAAPDCIESTTPVLPDLSQSVCNGHDPTNPSLAFKTTDGIVYSANPSSGWQPGDSVVVTATLTSGFKFSAATTANGWTVAGNSATKSFKFNDAPDCLGIATPTGPNVTQSVCLGHNPTDPTLTFPATDGIDYSASPAGGYKPGDTVVVTATLKHGYKFGGTLAGWTVAGNSATKSVTFNNAPDCRESTNPVNPTVHQSICKSGPVATAPTLDVPADTVDVHYSVPAGPYTAPSTVTVTADAQSGYKFATTAPAGWTRVSDSVETYLVTFNPSPDCRSVVSPAAPTLVQQDCPATGTTPVAPTLTLPSTTGIAYSVDKPAPYQAGDAVTVTATTDSGYKLAASLPAGWDRVSDTVATYAAQFDAGFTCGVPVAPSLTQSTCPTSGTTPVAPTLTLPTTASVVYTVDKPAPYAGGDVVVVTATAQAGHQFDKTAPAGWTRFSDTVETYMLQFDASPNCAETTPPTFTDDVCVSSVPTAATYTIADTTGVDYYVDSVLTAAGTYTATDGSTITVEAKPQLGYTLVGTTTWSHQFLAIPDCTDAAKVVKASFTDDKCVNNELRGATYTVPSTTGVSYTVNGKSVSGGTYKASAGSTVTIVATAKPGYTLQGTTSWSHAFGATPQCRGTDAQHVQKPTSPLASTGVPTASLLGVGIGLLLVGGACTFLAASRRRRTDG